MGVLHLICFTTTLSDTTSYNQNPIFHYGSTLVIPEGWSEDDRSCRSYPSEYLKREKIRDVVAGVSIGYPGQQQLKQ